MRKLLFLVCGIILFQCLQSCFWKDERPRVLVFIKTEFDLNERTPAAVAALKKITAKNNIALDVEEDESIFTEENLCQYAAVIFLNTIGDVLNSTQQIEFERYIQAGGGFVGIHTAVDTEHNWEWYRGLLGAVYDGQSEVQDAQVQVLDHTSLSTKHLDSSWQLRDEWFNLRNIDPSVQVLLNLDESSCQGGNMGEKHPVSWQHEYDGGRAFITTMGHSKASYTNPGFLQHLLGAIHYAIGENKPLNFKDHHRHVKANTSGFVKTELRCDLNEPMELDMLPDGRILFIERGGVIKLFDPENSALKVLHTLDVFLKNEGGLTGMAIDPNWDENHWIYLFYSPAGPKSITQLSRFDFDGDTFDSNSEKIILTLPSEREQLCSHGGGSIEFDANGYLYIGTGDNTNPYDVDGYAPIDERPGRYSWDAQRTAGNSMQLFGKILRIKPLPDGSYSCPAGNLFVQTERQFSHKSRAFLIDPFWGNIIHPTNEQLRSGSTATKSCTSQEGWTGAPEIYIMGCRNPFRFSIDNRRQLLVWGDAGCDAGLADSTRGPEGYDEVNWTRTAGFYGWPYFIGNNQAFRDYDYATRTARPAYNPLAPQNDSPNNFGARQLPPARPASIWYAFRSSAEFPLVANGTRCVLAGPVYYCDKYPPETRFPDRFDGKLIIYEWMRNWMMAVELDSMDRYVGMEPLASTVPLSRPIDMLIDKNGSIWMLEYGTEWYSSNPDACLSRIDYVRNNATAELADTPDQKLPAIRWNFGGKNRSFYREGELLHYEVLVADSELGGRPLSAPYIRIDYIEPDKNINQADLAVVEPTLAPGKALIAKSDCQSCHDVQRTVNGPSYQAIAQRYGSEKATIQKLVQKVKKGGTGIWGKHMMSPHPQLETSVIQKMVCWILEQGKAGSSPPMRGQFELTIPEKTGKKEGGKYVFTAQVTTQQSGSKSATLVLRPAKQQLENADSLSTGIQRFKPFPKEQQLVHTLRKHQFFAFKNVELRGISAVTICLFNDPKHGFAGGQIELRLGSPEGRLISSTTVPPGKNSDQKPPFFEIQLPINRADWPTGETFQDIYFVAKSERQSAGPVAVIDWVRFEW
jgi:cytochrome c